MAVTIATETQPKRSSFVDGQLNKSEGKKNRELGKDAFLTMMVAQFKIRTL